MNDFSDFLEEEAVPRNLLLEKYFRINNEYMATVEQYEIDYIEDDDPTLQKYVSMFCEDNDDTKVEKIKNFSLFSYLYRIISKNMTINDIKKVIKV
jgi:hypothetical protein